MTGDVDQETAVAMVGAVSGIAHDNGGLAVSVEAARLLLQAVFETCEIHGVGLSREQVREALLLVFGGVVDIVIDQANEAAR